MKLKITLLLLIISINLNYAQNTYKWPEFGISFTSKVRYNFEPSYGDGEDQSTLWRLDADEIGIEVEACILSEQSSRFIENIEYAANEIASDMEYSPIIDGQQITGNFRGYYVRSIDVDYDETKYPVIIAAIIDDKNKMSFEIIIDCYRVSLQNGIDLLNSIKYIPRN